MANGVAFNADYPTIENSEALYARALGLIPKVTQTLAKAPGQFTKGASPIYLQRGKGSHVWDVDGNEYVDFGMGIGPISLGYAYDRVDDAIREQLADGITFSLMHPLEVEVAETIREVIPNAESVRFSKSGADVCSAAIRLARAYTGKEKVLCCGYHGWHDWYIATTDRDKGVASFNADLTYTFQYDDIQHFSDSLQDDVGAVILEPTVFDAPSPDFLPEVARLCRERGAVLIFDEMWTGFRMALGGAQEAFDVKPDLAVYSKAVANGMPLAVICGRKEIMDLCEEQVFFYTTFGGEALSLAAAQATVGVMKDEDVFGHLKRVGTKLRDGYNAICQEIGLDATGCKGYPWRSLITFDATKGNPLEMKAFVQQEMIKRGVLWGGFHNVCFSHTDADVDHTLAVYREVLPLFADALASGDVKSKLKGAPLEPVFRKTGNFNTKPRG